MTCDRIGELGKEMGRAEQHNANTTRVLRKHQRLSTNTAPPRPKGTNKKKQTNSSQHLNFEIYTYINFFYKYLTILLRSENL